jgi:peroxiredoxin
LDLRRALPTAIVIAAVSCSLSPAGKHARLEENGNAASDFTLTDARGATAKLSDYKGRVVLLNFWATWCGPCKIEIPWFIEFEKIYKDRGFAVLGISMDDDGWKAVKPFIEQKAVNYRVMVGDDNVARLYGGVESLPSTFLIDREGKVASTHVGLATRSDYETEILRLLGDKRVGAP